MGIPVDKSNSGRRCGSALLFDDAKTDAERKEKARLEKFVYNAGEDDAQIELKSKLAGA